MSSNIITDEAKIMDRWEQRFRELMENDLEEEEEHEEQTELDELETLQQEERRDKKEHRMDII